MAPRSNIEASVSDFGAALTHFQRGVERLRRSAPEQANNLSRMVNELSNSLLQTIAQLDEEEDVPPSPSPSAESRDTGLASPSLPGHRVIHPKAQLSALRGNENAHPQSITSPLSGQSRETTPSLTFSPNPSIWQGFRPATASPQVGPSYASNTQTGDWPRITSPPRKPVVGNQSSPANQTPTKPQAKQSWASVAALDSAAQAKLVNKPSGPQMFFTESKAEAVIYSEPIEKQNRAVWIFSLPASITLKDVTAIITEGPLNSIRLCAYPTNAARSACIIFKDAETAEVFKENVDQNALKAKWGPEVEIMEGLACPIDASIRIMEFPVSARRRLTVVRSRLFATLSKSTFEKDIRTWAGPENVELIFVYNLGNATVVLASVHCAQIVKGRIESKARKSGPYEGAVVSYSKDPTEAPLRLVAAPMMDTYVHH